MICFTESALTGELKICRLSATVGNVDGGEEVFMFVEKVCKSELNIDRFCAVVFNRGEFARPKNVVEYLSL